MKMLAPLSEKQTSGIVMLIHLPNATQALGRNLLFALKVAA